MDNNVVEAEILEELAFDPSVNSANISVSVRNGIATLGGHVGSYVEKIAAEKAAGRVRGVKALVEEIVVRPLADRRTSDELTAERAVFVLSWHAQVPEGVKVKVENGWVTLTGLVSWQYQRLAAEKAVRKLADVVGVTNLIELEAAGQVADVKARIEDALKRDAKLDAKAIKVTIRDGERVVLEGRVNARYEKDLAERAAWSAPGIRFVEDRLSVGE